VVVVASPYLGPPLTNQVEVDGTTGWDLAPYLVLGIVGPVVEYWEIRVLEGAGPLKDLLEGGICPLSLGLKRNKY
jgi:hypothetical protein